MLKNIETSSATQIVVQRPDKEFSNLPIDSKNNSFLNDVLHEEEKEEGLISENNQPIFFGVLDFMHQSNGGSPVPALNLVYFQVVKKPIRTASIGCLAGIIATSILMPFPFSVPIVLAFTAFLLTLIKYRLKIYKNL